MGSGKPGVEREVRFDMKMSKSEYGMLQKMAKEADRSMSNFLRRLIKETYEVLERDKALRKRGGL
jgi:predicted CopG family antitoxin